MNKSLLNNAIELERNVWKVYTALRVDDHTLHLNREQLFNAANLTISCIEACLDDPTHPRNHAYKQQASHCIDLTCHSLEEILRAQPGAFATSPQIVRHLLRDAKKLKRQLKRTVFSRMAYAS